MSSRETEETPLLQSQNDRNAGRTPLPWRQFSVVLLPQLAEPLTFQSVSPFASQLVRDVGITNGDETQVGYYVVLLHSTFYATQALSAFPWSGLSDHIGRKPVLLTGLFGLSASMYCFGLSKTFWGLMISRSLNVFNGNMGAMKSMIVEMTDHTNLPQAFAYLPLAWSCGASLGSFIGSSLSNPVGQFPDTFGARGFFKEYPYFLACAVPATFSALAWLITYLFLRETCHQPVSLGELIRVKLCGRSAKESITPTSDPSNELLRNEDAGEVAEAEEAPLPLRSLLVPRVLVAAANYTCLSLVETSFRALQPIFFATPIELGGLGLDVPQIGSILFMHGVLVGLFHAFFFAGIYDRFGAKAIYSVSVVSFAPLVLTFPLLNAFARVQGSSWITWSMVGVHVALYMAMNFGYSCMFIYIAASSPNRASIGATYGIAQLLASVTRMIGPALVASIFSISLKTYEHAWLGYLYMLLLSGVAIAASLLLPRRLWNHPVG